MRTGIAGLGQIDKPGRAAHIANMSLIVRLALAFALALSVPACGIKSDLLMPNGKATPKNQKDPSRPPQPIGR